MTTSDDPGKPKDDRVGRTPSPGRQRQQRRIVQATRALAVGGVAATAAFALAAAHSGGRSAAATSNPEPVAGTGTTEPAPVASADGFATDDGGEDGEGYWDDDGERSGRSSSITPSPVAPTPSLAPPVAQSGAS